MTTKVDIHSPEAEYIKWFDILDPLDVFNIGEGLAPERIEEIYWELFAEAHETKNISRIMEVSSAFESLTKRQGEKFQGPYTIYHVRVRPDAKITRKDGNKTLCGLTFTSSKAQGYASMTRYPESEVCEECNRLLSLGMKFKRRSEP